MVGGRSVFAGVILAVLAAGCSGPPDVPAGLTWPVRQDRFVERTPPTPPAGPAAPGQFDVTLAAFDREGGKTLDPAALTESQLSDLRKALEAVFGTPSAPRLNGDAEVESLAAELHLTPDRLSAGSRLYRRHCLQCHGSAGDGRGPTGPWVYPLPRDFRNGQYKFVSTPGGTGLARHDDLVRVTRHGIEGTSMPAFKLLPDAEHDLLATAVTHLSLRGRSEIAALRALLAGDESDSDNDITAAISAGLKTALRRQVDVERQAVPAEVPDLARSELEESVVRGLRLFTDPAGAGCAGCHVDFGRKSAYRYDVWGAAVRPNDLTAGVYKGGRRPEDVFWRIRCGVNPAGMPAAALLSDDDVRDLVRFVRALPDKQALPADVRATVYGD